MKKLAVVLVVAMLFAQAAFAISFADGYKSSGIWGSNVHVHIKTTPCKIYSVTITPTANLGYAKLIETKGPLASGAEYINGYNHILVYAQGATAGNTIQLTYPEGINCFGNLMVSAVNADVVVQYKE